MTLYVGSREAAHRLGVSRATLYAYVSRGLVERRTAIDGKTSMYSLDDLDRLHSRSRRRAPEPRPSIDVQISSAITRLDEHQLTYRERNTVELARTVGFEQVAELLWTGSLPSERPIWPTAGTRDRAACAQAIDALGPSATALQRLTATATVLGAHHADDDPPAAARRLLAVAAGPSGRDRRATMAERFARRWHPSPTPALVTAIDRSLVLLADHELATSTLAVRVATSVRTDAYAALTAGLATLTGRLHGSAAVGAYQLLREAAESGAREAVRRRLDQGERLPGFGHTVYRNGDPRLEPLLEAAWELPAATERRAGVDEVLREAGLRLDHRANVDFGLAVLAYLGDLDPDVPIFATARIAGWTAHCLEESQERPIRFRGLARYVTER
jgi:citrate synthase